MLRWRSLIDEALMAGLEFHGRHYSKRLRSSIRRVFLGGRHFPRPHVGK
jgi:hypothetical protein